MSQKTLLSGIQPTGKPHLGNYFGALKQWVDLQNQYDTYLFIADYHSLTTLHDAALLRENVHGLVLDLLAIGLDPEKVTLFKQSDVPEHTELARIFNCMVTVPWLSRAHAFKDKTDKGFEANVGLFTYPVLMSADILMYDADVVPVGSDQRQHIEMAREIAAKFNHTYGETFPEPQELILDSVAVVPGTDGQKMSKSYKNTIPLFGTDEEIKKAVMGIVTDSNGETPANVYAIHQLFRTHDELADIYEEHRGKYKNLKEALLADILAFVAPMRERRAYYEAHPEIVEEILKNGAAKAQAKAQAKMQQVRKVVGLD